MTSARQIIWLGWAAGIALIVLSRLPHLSGAGAVLDGDEAILALMSKHLSEGGPIELFFYGQSFGVTLIENANAALFFLLLGVSTTSLKIATLFLWITGWSFFLFGTRRLTDVPTALVAGLLLAGCSAWGLWSTLARGYHVGGFMLCQLCYWQFAGLYKTTALAGTKSGSFALLGASVGLLFLTQKLWFISFLPFLLIVLWQRKNLRETLILLACIAGVTALPQFLPGNPSKYWDPQYLQGFEPVLALTLLPERVWTFFSGAYSYSTRMDSSLFTRIAASGWCLLLIISGIALTKRLRAGPDRSLAAAIIAAGLLVMGTTLFINVPLFGYRYLLPLASLSCLAISLWIMNAHTQKLSFGPASTTVATIVIALILVATGFQATMAGNSFRATAPFTRTQLTPEESIDRLIRDLQAQDIHHVYSLDPMLQWIIIFSSRESVIARWSDPMDRRPEYPLQVDQALFAGDNIAIVGTAASLDAFREFLRGQDSGTLPIYLAGDRYFWLPNPSKNLLRAIGFELNPESISGKTE